VIRRDERGCGSVWKWSEHEDESEPHFSLFECVMGCDGLIGKMIAFIPFSFTTM
jgi:hypothetical protein